MISIFSSNPLLMAVAILLLTTITLIVTVVRLHIKMKRFIVGLDSDNITDSLSFVSSGLKDLDQFRKEMEVYLTSVEKRLKKSVQSVHTIRFNPFHGTGAGGNQSFATAFLTEDGEGVVVSSLYSREHVSIFSKPVKNYSSEHELSDEEKEALSKAKEKLGK